MEINDKLTIEEYANYFKILSNDVRLCILTNLCKFDKLCANDLQVCSRGSQPYVSQQLNKLKDLKIVESEKIGLQVFYKLSDKNICKIIHELKICSDCCKKGENNND